MPWVNDVGHGIGEAETNMVDQGNSASHFLDIVIVNYESTDFLFRCLESIRNTAHDLAFKVHIQDNDSQDHVERVRDGFPEVVLTRNDRNLGYARAVNNALKQCAAPYILILNPDTIIKKPFFEGILQYMEQNPEVGILGPKIVDPDGSVQGSARRFPNFLTALFGRNTLITKYFPKNPITRANLLTLRSDGKTPMAVDWVSGACMLVRGRAIDDVGDMDSRFFLYWEDADWCRRMQEKGWEVIYFPSAEVVHHVGGSSETRRFRSALEFHKSCYRLVDKYRIAPLRVLKPIVAVILAFRLSAVLISNALRVHHLKGLIGYGEAEETLSTSAPIKVVRIIARLNIGGPAIHVHLLTKGLNSGRFRSLLVTGRISEQEGDMNYLFGPDDPKPIHIQDLHREIGLKNDLTALIRVFRLLRREKPDIVHTHTAKAGTIGRLAVLLYKGLYRKKVRLVHTFHGHVFEGYFGKLKTWAFLKIERILARTTDRIVAISETQKRELSERFQIAEPGKITIVRLGFDLSPFLNNGKAKGSFRARVGADEHALLVGIIGRLVPIKNHALFLEGARLFLEQNPQIRAKFVIVGDGELKDELEEHCETLGIGDHVRFCGWVKDVAGIYGDLDVLALTSRNEGTPVSIIEAMASSVPVIATNAGGVPDLLGAQIRPISDVLAICERGILCRKDDPEGFAKGLEYMAESNADERQERTDRARAYVQKTYSSERLVGDIKNTYLDLLGYTNTG